MTGEFSSTPLATDVSSERPLLIGVLALVWLYLAMDIATHTMALDGVIYAGIAKLTAAGAGSFWFPPHFESGVESFHDHPPLGLWLLAKWFVVFGDGFWVERAFNMMLTLGVAAIILNLWSRSVGESAHPTGGIPLGWWPLAIFFLMPVSTYALKNNSLEGLLALTTLLGVRAAWSGRTIPAMNILVGVACLVAVLVKGPVGLFPLAAPACFALLVDNHPRHACVHSLIATVPVALGVAVLANIEPAMAGLQPYLDGQLLASLAGERLIEHDRMYQLGQLTLNVAIGALLVLPVWAVRRKVRISGVFKAYLAIGLLASLPLLISPRQYKHYLLSSLPYFALCLALLVQPKILRWRKEVAWLAAGALLALAVTRTIWYWGEDGKDQEQLNDAQAIASVVGTDSVSFCTASLQRRAYLTRYHGLRSAWVDANTAQAYFVCQQDFNDERFSQVQLLSEDLVLWRRTARGDQKLSINRAPPSSRLEKVIVPPLAIMI